MNDILCIVGPTGTGKTVKAINIATRQPSILISADSRQVYRSMDIVTGKDHPRDINIFGIDIVDPDEPCSVSVWYNSVMPHIQQAWKEEILPIIVGGTGLYVKAITDGIETMEIPINDELRNELSLLPLEELQIVLKNVDSKKYESMNNSDKQNPRRLIRAIEVTKSGSTPTPRSFSINSKLIEISPPPDDIYSKMIKDRVNSRLELGAIEETKKLIDKYGKSVPSMSAIGYKSIIQYLEGNFSKQKLIEIWVRDEINYAKRQVTWIKKQKSNWTGEIV